MITTHLKLNSKCLLGVLLQNIFTNDLNVFGVKKQDVVVVNVVEKNNSEKQNNNKQNRQIHREEFSYSGVGIFYQDFAQVHAN